MTSSTQTARVLIEAAKAAIPDWDHVALAVGGGMRGTETVPAFVKLANPAAILPLAENYLAVVEALKGLSALYDTDEGCRSVPEYVKARAAVRAAEGEGV